MKCEIGRPERILTNEELKGALGGADKIPPSSGNNASVQQTDARAVVIGTGHGKKGQASNPPLHFPGEEWLDSSYTDGRWSW